MTLPATDSFTGTNGTNLETYSSNWTAVSGAGDMKIQSNAVCPADAAVVVCYRWNADTFPNNQYSQVKFVSSGASSWLGPAVRVATGGANTCYGWYFTVSNQTLAEITAGSGAVLVTSTVTVTAGDICRIEVVGNLINCYKNGIPVPDMTGISDASITAGAAGLLGNGTSTSELRDDFAAGAYVPPATATLAPDSIAESTNLVGTVADIDEDPDAADASWLTATDATAATDLRVTFPSPSGLPTSTQNFRYLLRKTAGAVHPTITAELLQAGTFRKTLTAAGTPITSTSGQVLQGNWNSSDLETLLDGSDVECRIVSVVGGTFNPGGLPAYSATGQAAAVATSTVASTISPAKPSTVNAGDLLILQVVARNTDLDAYPPATVTGFTPFTDNPFGSASMITRQGLYWRIAGAGEASQTVSVTGTGGAGSDLLAARIYRFTAADGFAASPIAGIVAREGTSSPCYAPATVSPTGANQRAVCALVTGTSAATMGSMTGETDGNWVESAYAASGQGGNGSLGIQTSDQSSGIAISGGSVAFSGSGAAYWQSVGFVLVPVELGGGVATNTVEVGAVEWNVSYTPGITAEAAACILKSLDATCSADVDAILIGTILTDQSPEIPVAADSTAVTIGTQFFASKFGHIRYIRWYNGRSTGMRTHKVGLFTEDGSALSVVELTAELSPGWQITELPEPIEVDDSVKYVAAVFWPEGQYPVTDGGLATQIDNADLHAFASGGKKTAGDDLTFPVD